MLLYIGIVATEKYFSMNKPYQVIHLFRLRDADTKHLSTRLTLLQTGPAVEIPRSRQHRHENAVQ